MTIARWNAVVGAALAAGTLALVVGNPLLLAVAVVPLSYAVYSFASGTPAPTLAVERDIDPERPEPGEPVRVTLTVENVGEAPIPDLRVADDPPPVPVDGSTARASALRVGEAVTVSYELSLPRGSHAFGDPVLEARGIAGRGGSRGRCQAAGHSEVTCQTLLDEVPLRDRTIHYVGRTPTDSGGSGVEFYSTREYQRGDPVNRIDWRRFARTGDLTTVDMREERSITVVFLLDDRPSAQRSWPGYGPDTLDLTTYAASRAVPTLLEANHRVGVATYGGLESEAPEEYTDPGRSAATRSAAEATLERARADGGASAVSSRPGGNADTGAGLESATGNDDRATSTDAAVVRTLRERLPANAQVVCCSPLTDGFVVDLAVELEASGHALTVLSPDLSTAGGEPSPGAAARTLERSVRLDRLRRHGVPVVDWSLADPLALTLARVFETWGEVR